MEQLFGSLDAKEKKSYKLYTKGYGIGTVTAWLAAQGDREAMDFVNKKRYKKGR